MTLSLGLLLPAAASTQQRGDSQPSSAAPAATNANTVDRISIEGVLRRYETAYNHQSVDELVAVWPSLQNDKKSFTKMKDEFGRADISDRKVSMEVKDVQVAADGNFLVRCTRSEQYMKLQNTTYTSGDLQMGATPVQNPGPSHLTDKKTVHKTNDVWLTLHKDGNAWTIASVSDKKPR